MRLILAIVACFAFALVSSQTTPAKGSELRKALMDALRVPIQKELKQKVQFKVDYLKVQGGWAFMKGSPVQPNGSEINFKGTKYSRAAKDGMFDNIVEALFQKKGSKWTVVKYAYGNTDVPYGMWWRDYGAPKSIFDYTENGG
jgi:hypothetical protein